MNNSQYWQKRAEQISNIQFKKADKLSRNIAKEYQKAERYIQERINLYYARYAKEYGVDLADAKILLSPSELNNFKMTIEEFRKKAIENDDGKWTKELDEEYLRSRISRLEALKMDINNKIYELSGKVNEETEEHLKKVYKDTYLRNITTYGNELGIGNNFERLNEDVINKAIYTRWTNEKNFAGRLDDNKKTLLSSINKTITQGLITGASSDAMVEKLMKETKISRNRAINIVQTETTFIIGQANTQMYKDFGVEEYEIIETLDSVTCETCAEMDGKIGKVSEKVEGVNAPPFHPRCRGTTIPVSKYAETWGNEQRIARDDSGEISYTNAKNYKEWKEKNNLKVETDLKSNDNLKNTNKYDKISSNDELNEALKNKLEEVYERNRKELNLNMTPLEQLKDNKISPFGVEFGNVDNKIAKEWAEQFEILSDEYYTTCTKITQTKICDADIYRPDVINRTELNYMVSNSEILINDNLTNYDDYISRISKMVDNGHSVKVAEADYKKYVATHEFAHTLTYVNQEKYKSFVGADTKKIKKFNESIKELYKDYQKELNDLFEESRQLDIKFVMDTSNYTEADKSRRKFLAERMDSITISRYANENEEEFMAEAFADYKIGSEKSEYSIKVGKLIDEVFRRNI